MPDVDQALTDIAAARRSDPLAPVTVVAPSHAAALQLRRRLAALGPFAAVRFETLPRVAELLAAGELAGRGRTPLARPIGDFVAEQVALDSRGRLAAVREVPGYARTLRQIFRRLRRGAVRTSAEVRLTARAGHLGEILRLYDMFRERTRAFYDEEDLLDAASEAVRGGRAGVLADLGEVYVVPPGPLTAAGAALLDALRAVAKVVDLDEAAGSPEQTFVIAPDPASEAQEAVRAVLQALADGTPVHEIAVFYGAAEGYSRLLREAFAAAGVASVPLPGIPVAETRAGRGVLSLARLPELDYARTAVMDFLSVAPVREWLPCGDDRTRELTTSWDRVSREAEITHGADRWQTRLEAFAAACDADAAGLDSEEHESRISALKAEAGRARELGGVIEALVGRLEPLRQEQPAPQFIDAFRAAVQDYIDKKAPGLDEALEEIDQLGTIGAVGGGFSLIGFAESLGANLEARCIRPKRLGDGVIIADYRAAAGMRFDRVVLCGAYEGAFPAGPGTDAIIDDGTWRALREQHPHVEDAEVRIQRAHQAAWRAAASAVTGLLTWSAPAFEPGGTREFYPSPLMAQAYTKLVGERVTASALRSKVSGPAIRRLASPLASVVRGPVLTPGELGIREAVTLSRRGPVPPGHPRHRSVAALEARRSNEFSEWDGSLAAFDDPAWLQIQSAVSPTSLEAYAACGYKYFCKSLLRLQVVEEPDERQVMEPMTRGTLVHDILETFFREQHANGRPQPNEAWTESDLARLMEITDEVLGVARQRGQTGLDVFAQHETRTIRADLARFLEADTTFRRETGAVPAEFEVMIPDTQVAGVTLRGRVDRIDRTADRMRAWVIDYKTGGTWDTKGMDTDPLKGGTKLQLPVYLAAVSDAQEATALYWFITQRGDFERVPYRRTPELDARFQATLQAIVEGIRAGAFPAVSDEESEFYNRFENCRYCDFDRICSRRRDLEFEAKRQDPHVGAWLGVAEAASPEADE